MPGSKATGLKTALTNKEKYGEDFYSVISKQGVAAYRERQKAGIAKPRGFAAMSPEKRRAAAAKGGKVSRQNGRVSHAT